MAISLESAQLAANMGCRGKLGGWIIQGATHTNANYHDPQGRPLLIKPEIAQPDPRTERQQAQRLIVAHATRDWQNGTPEERARGAETAKRKNLPLFQGYLSLRIKELIEMPTIDDIPGLRDTLDGLQASIDAIASEQVFSESWTFQPVVWTNGSPSTATYYLQEGLAVSVGDLLFVSWRIGISSISPDAGYIWVKNIPLLDLLPAGPPIIGTGWIQDASSSQFVQLLWQKSINQDSFIGLLGDSGPTTVLDASHLKSGSQLRGSIMLKR